MATELIIPLLKKQPLFSELSPEELKELAAIAKSERFPEKARIVEQGELKPVYYIILSGEAIARALDEFGRERPVRFLQAGDSFGETSLLVGEPRDATVIARTDLEVVYIEKADFDRLLSQRPEIRRKLRPRPEVKRLWEAPRYDWMVEGEVVVWHGHRHWCTLTRFFIFAPLSLGFLAFLAYMAYRTKMPLCFLPIGVAFLLWLFFSSVALWNWHYDRYIVTNRRVALIETIPYRVAARQEALLERVQEVDTRKSFPKSIFGVGDVIISTAARTRPILFQSIHRPEEVEKIIQEQKARAMRWERAEERGRIKRRLAGEELPPPPPPPQPTHRLPSIFYAFIGEKREPGQATWYTHWWVLIRRAWLQAILFIISLGIFVLSFKLKGWFICGFPLCAFFTLWFLTKLIDWSNERYIVNAQQVIMLRIMPIAPFIPPVGPLSRIERKVAPLGSIQDVTTKMSNFGRIMGVLGLGEMGDVLITTAAPAGVLEFKNVRNPLKVQAVIFEFLERYQERQREERLKETERLLEDWFQAHKEIEH